MPVPVPSDKQAHQMTDMHPLLRAFLAQDFEGRHVLRQYMGVRAVAASASVVSGCGCRLKDLRGAKVRGGKGAVLLFGRRSMKGLSPSSVLQRCKEGRNRLYSADERGRTPAGLARESAEPSDLPRLMLPFTTCCVSPAYTSSSVLGFSLHLAPGGRQ